MATQNPDRVETEVEETIIPSLLGGVNENEDQMLSEKDELGVCYINFGDASDIIKVKGVGVKILGVIMGLRGRFGNITKEMFVSIVPNGLNLSHSFSFEFNPNLVEMPVGYAHMGAKPKSNKPLSPEEVLSNPSPKDKKPVKRENPDFISQLIDVADNFEKRREGKLPSHPEKDDFQLPLPPSFDSRQFSGASQSRQSRSFRANSRVSTMRPDFFEDEDPNPLFRPDVSKDKALPRGLYFDGKESWASFRCKFQTYAEEQGWSDAQMRNQLCYCLSGTMSDFFSVLIQRSPMISYAEIIRRLNDRFDLKELPETSQMRFQAAVQGPKEGISEWAERILNLAYEAHPDMNHNQIFRVAIVRFCAGLCNKDAGHYAFMSRPESLEQAVDVVRRYSYADQFFYAKTGIKYLSLETDEESPRICRTGRRYSASSRSPSPKPVDKRVTFSDEGKRSLTEVERTFNERFKALESKVESQSSNFQTLVASISRLEGLLRRNRSPVRGRSPSPNTCFSCGKPGHFSRECPEKNRKLPSVSLVQEEGNDSGSES